MGKTLDEVDDMPIAELVRWTAFEQVYGPVLVHERLDLGLAKLSYYIVSLLTEKRYKVRYRDFLPMYLQDLVKQASGSEDHLRLFFEGLANANDQYPNG